MSLRVDDSRGDRSGRSRSKTRERSRSRTRDVSPQPAPKASTEPRKNRPSRAAAEEDEAPAYEVRSPSAVTPGLSSWASGRPDFLEEGDDVDEPPLPTTLPSSRSRKYDPPDETSLPTTVPSRSKKYEEDEEPPLPTTLPSRSKRYEEAEEPPLPTTLPSRSRKYDDDSPSSRSYKDPTPLKTAGTFPADTKRGSTSKSTPYPESETGMPSYPADDSYTQMPSIPTYAEMPKYQYATPPEKITYTEKPHTGGNKASYSSSSKAQSHPQPTRSVSFPSDVDKGKEEDPPEASRPKLSRLSVSEAKFDTRAPSPSGRNRLSVSSGAAESHVPGQAPPASPLLEAYHGTYQSMSPMPSPMMLPEADDDLDDVPPLSPDTPSEMESRPRAVKMAPGGKKSVKIYDAEGDANLLGDALNHSTARSKPLIDILPDLTHDQLLALREEYKKQVKVQGRGVNLSKHIKVKTTGNFGKICYVTSLGRWESDCYWANFWYQSHSSNRELLIEALMGRTNADIREIKDSFRDKRYNDSLSRCMEKELKPDKFRTAVLMALEGKRQEETDAWPVEYRNRDVEILRRALTGKEGGETAILQVVVMRSDNHLREVLKTYEKMYESNFARDALRKSNNLVGEVIAHILNGVINRQARDALLLKHAVEDISSKNREVELRYELLMSRLVRLHWDRAHLARVKEEFKNKYRTELEREVRLATKGDFGEFSLRLCET